MWAGLPTEMAEKMKAFERENPELRPANEIVRRAKGIRAPIQMMIAFIEDHRGVYGVEPICRILPIAPSTYHAHAARRAGPSRLSARTKHDTVLTAEVRRVFDQNVGVYGVRKVWRQMMREGFVVAQCIVSRLMREMGLPGAVAR